MAPTTSRSPSVALANGDTPLWRFNGLIKGVVLERPDSPDACAFYNPKRNCFSVMGRAQGGALRAQIVGGPDCGTVFLIGPEWDDPESWGRMCSVVSERS